MHVCGADQCTTFVVARAKGVPPAMPLSGSHHLEAVRWSSMEGGNTVRAYCGRTGC